MTDEVLVPFSVAAAATGPSVPREAAPHHQRLITLWRDVGVLVVPEDDPRSALARNISELPQAVRKYWQEALEEAGLGKLRLFGQSALEGRLERCGAGLPAGCSTLARVVAADRETVSLQSSKHGSHVEFATIDVVDQARAFVQARELGTSPIPEGADTAQAWSQRIRPLFRSASRRVTLIDRYAASRIDYKRRDRLRFAPLGLSRFLAAALALPGDVAVEIITGPTEPGQRGPERVIADEARECGGDDRRRVTARVVSDRRWKQKVHYRGICVDSATFLELNFGIEAFDGPKVSKTVFAHLHPMRTDVLRDVVSLQSASIRYDV